MNRGDAANGLYVDADRDAEVVWIPIVLERRLAVSTFASSARRSCAG